MPKSLESRCMSDSRTSVVLPFSRVSWPRRLHGTFSLEKAILSVRQKSHMPCGNRVTDHAAAKRAHAEPGQAKNAALPTFLPLLRLAWIQPSYVTIDPGCQRWVRLI